VITRATARRRRAASPGAQIDFLADRRDGVINWRALVGPLPEAEGPE